MNSNLDVVRGIYQAFSVGNIPGVLGALAPNVQWTEAAGGPYGGLSIGPDAVLGNVFMKIGGSGTALPLFPASLSLMAPPSSRSVSTAALTRPPARASRHPSPMCGNSRTGRQCRSISTRTRPFICSRCTHSSPVAALVVEPGFGKIMAIG